VLSVKDRWSDSNQLYFPLEDWPKQIRSIALFPDAVEVLSPWLFKTTSEARALGLVAGGGHGHWGIIVCVDTNSVPEAVGTLVLWDNGVYFWME